jgi:hypothetical protein
MWKKIFAAAFLSGALVVATAAWAEESAAASHQNVAASNMMGGGMMGNGWMGNGMMGNEWMGNGMMGNGWMGSYMMNGYGQNAPIQALINLGLTDQQISSLVDLHANLMKQQLSLLRQQHMLADEISNLRDSSSPDFAKLQSDMAAYGDVNGKLEVEFLKVRSDALNVLTASQRQELGDQDLPLFGSRWGMGYGSMSYQHQMGMNAGGGTMGSGMRGPARSQ